MKIKAVFKIREVSIPRGYRKLLRGETVKSGDFVFYSLGSDEDNDPHWNQLTTEEIIGEKQNAGQEKQWQSDWIIRKIE